MPNTLAYLMIAIWPLFAVFAYRRFDSIVASFLVIIGGYMFLPANTNFDLPMIPPIGKDQITGLSALFCLMFIKRTKIYFLGADSLQKALFLVLLIIPFINVFFNTEPVFNGKEVIRGLTPYDSISSVINSYLFLLPFIVGVSLKLDSLSIIRIRNYLIYAGLIYSVFALLEIRLSPQLHNWLYGFFPSSFGQQHRFGGFRPVVFMGHGLLVAVFFMISCCACYSAIFDSNRRERKFFVAALCYLIVVLVLSKTLTAILLFLTFVVLFHLTRWNGTKVLYLCFVGFLAYPILSIFNLIPYDAIINFFEGINRERASSLAYRFMNEATLVAHSIEKLFVGLGGWSRNRLFNSITDGQWIILFSTYGIIYIIAYFSLAVLPALNNVRNQPFLKRQNSFLALITILMVVLIDQIPNSSIGHSWVWFLAGIAANSSIKYQPSSSFSSLDSRASNHKNVSTLS